MKAYARTFQVKGNEVQEMAFDMGAVYFVIGKLCDGRQFPYIIELSLDAIRHGDFMQRLVTPARDSIVHRTYAHAENIVSAEEKGDIDYDSMKKFGRATEHLFSILFNQNERRAA